MKQNPASPTIVHNVERRRFELCAGGAMAVLEYTVEDGGIGFDHTHVPDALRGKGAGSALVRGALAEARRLGWRVIPRCSFVAAFLQRHPGLAEVAEPPQPSPPQPSTPLVPKKT